MARRAPVLSDVDQDDVPPDPTVEDEDGRRVRKAAQGAHKVWEPLKPKPRQPKPEGENKNTKDKTHAKPGGAKVGALSEQSTAKRYAAPDIDLDTSQDESPPPRPRIFKKTRVPSSNEGSEDEVDEAEDEVAVKAEKPRSSRSKGKQKASPYQSEDDGSDDSEERQNLEEEDEDEESGPSGLEELEDKDPSALQAKFDSEAPTWVDGGDHDNGDLDLFAPSPIASPCATSLNFDDADTARPPSKPKRSRTDSTGASEDKEDRRSEPQPTKKRTKVGASSVGRGKERESAHGEDTDEDGSLEEETEPTRDRVDERRRTRRREEESKRKREDERKRMKERERAERAKERERAERAKEQQRAEHTKERAKERERQRAALQELQERDCREQRERKQDEERQRKKELERERERKQEKERKRKLELDLESEREYEREHDEVIRQVRGKPKQRLGQKERDRDEMEDEPEERHDKRRGKGKTKTKPRPERTVGPSRSSATNKTGSRARTTTPSAKGGHRAGVQPSAGPPTKRRRNKQDEEVRFMSDKGSNSDEEPVPRKRRQNDEDPASSNEDDTKIDIVWFGNSRPNLTDQHPRVKQVASLAISDCELSVCTINAFPDDPDSDGTFMRDILVKHASALGYKDMIRVLKNRKDSSYWKKFATIPSQRVFLLRGRVKAKCEGAVRAAYALTIGDSEKVTWLQKDLAYIYPHDYKNRTVNGKEGFKPPIFENMLISSFFSRRQSYGHRISKHFQSSHPDKPDEKEIPAPMLALVSTAIFAAIDDFKYAHYDAAKFEVNLNLHVYRRNIAFLDHIKDKNIDAYHTLMHGLFKLVAGGVGGAADNLGHGMGYLDVDGMDRS